MQQLGKCAGVMLFCGNAAYMYIVQTGKFPCVSAFNCTNTEEETLSRIYTPILYVCKYGILFVASSPRTPITA